MIDVKNNPLETKRLILRAWKESDVDDFHEYASVPGVGEMAGWHHHDNIMTTKTIIDFFIKGNTVYAIVHKDDNKVIGSLGFHAAWTKGKPEYSNQVIIELGFALSKDYWGQGLIVEASQKTINFMFNNSKIDAISCSHFSDNSQSKRVIEKLGFKYIEYSRELYKPFNKVITSLHYLKYNPKNNMDKTD